MPIVYVPSAVRFRDTATGRFVSRATVDGYREESIEASEEAVSELGSQYYAGKLSQSEWEKSFKQEIKDEFIRQYLIGIGGLGVMTFSDWGRIGRALQTQYKFADNFAKDLPGMSEAAINARSNLYSRAAGSAFELGQRQAHKLSGKFSEELWQLGATEHCSDCIDLNARGWQPIGSLPTVPRAGSTKCLTNCDCHIQYR